MTKIFIKSTLNSPLRTKQDNIALTFIP